MQNPQFKFYKTDITDCQGINDIFEVEHPDIVVNFAAESHVDRSIENPEIFLKTNILCTQVLMEVCRKFGISRFHQVSTDVAYQRTYGLPVSISRFSNNYDSFHFLEKLIPLMIKYALNDKLFPVYGKRECPRLVVC